MTRKRGSLSARLILSVLLCLLWAAPSVVRAEASTLEGSVRTDDGLALAHVAVTLEGPAGTLVVTTDSRGRYRFSGLTPGEYEVTVDTPGLVLEPAARATVGDDPAELDLILSPAPVRERVVVTAARGEALHSNLGFSTSVIDRERIEERAAPSLLPLLQEIPGTATARTGGVGHQGSVFLRGGESRYAAVLIDGMPVNEAGGGFDWGTALPLSWKGSRWCAGRRAVSTATTPSPA